MSKRWAWLVAVLVAPLVLPAQVEAGRRGYRRGPVRSIFGTLYNTNSPEWRASGGNMFAYEQLMQQKLWMQQRQMYLKQQQMLQKQAAGKKSTNSAGGQIVPGASGRQGFAPPAPVKKKRRTYHPTGEVGKASASSGAEPTTSTTRTGPDGTGSVPHTGARTVITKRPGDP